MGSNPLTAKSLSGYFVDKLSVQEESRQLADQNLTAAAANPNYSVIVLEIIADSSFEEPIRHCAAVDLNNQIKTRWVPSSATPIPDGEKTGIMTLLVPLTLSTTSTIQAELMEALTVIGNHDFPGLWSALVPELKSSLEIAMNEKSLESVRGILTAFNVLLKKFGSQLKSHSDLLEPSSAMLLSTVEGLSMKFIDYSDGFASKVYVLIEALRTCFVMSCSLHLLDFNAFEGENAKEYLNELDTSHGNTPLHMKIGGESFHKYLKEFVESVCGLLVAASASPTCVRLTVNATKFLTIVSTSVHHELLSSDEILQKIINNVVIPNVMLRDEDEELFEKNYVEFVRRDMEGSDHPDARRINACKLLKGIAGNHKEKVIESVLTQINNCLKLFAEDPSANWKYKDCAIYLVVSLATKKAGGASISTDLVDVESFFRSVILPELQGQDVNACPILKAGALKFFTMFGTLIPKQPALGFVGDVVRFLGSDSNVVHSYAASCIEKLLLVKDNGVQARYTSVDIGPVFPVLMNNLCGALKKPNSEENLYVMRCLMRVLRIADMSSSERASLCITGLTPVLNRLCKDPKNPVFTYWLFEAISAVLRRAFEDNVSLVPIFEKWLVDILKFQVFHQNKSDLYPYAFQLTAQLVDYQMCTVLSPNLTFLSDFLALQKLWKQSAIAPALVCLLQSFLQQAPNVISNEEKLPSIVGIAIELVSSPSSEEEGFKVFYYLIENLRYDEIAEHMSDIRHSLVTRLENNKTATLVRCSIVFFSIFLVKHGNRKLAEAMSSAAKGGISFLDILSEFWIPNLKTIRGHMEIKLCAVASIKLLCEPPSLVAQVGSALWGKLLDGIVTLLSLPEEERVEDEPDFGEAATQGGYQATFVRLRNAGKKEEDPLKEIKDPKYYSVALLANYSAQLRRRFPQIIKKHLSPYNQALLLQLCVAYNRPIV